MFCKALLQKIPIWLKGIGKLSVLALGTVTILATSMKENNIEIPAATFQVTSDCKDASTNTGSLSVSINQDGNGIEKIFGDNYADFGFPSQDIRQTVDTTIVEGPQRKCTALHFFAAEESTYLFLCRNPGDQSLQCTIYLYP